jgi:hypothetical protein
MQHDHVPANMQQITPHVAPYKRPVLKRRRREAMSEEDIAAIRTKDRERMRQVVEPNL